MAVVTIFLLDFMFSRNVKHEQQKTMKELHHLKLDFFDPKANISGIFKFRHVHTRIYSTVDKGFFKLPKQSKFLTSNSQPNNHFIDAWNNPYWIYCSKKDKVHAKGWS